MKLTEQQDIAKLGVVNHARWWSKDMLHYCGRGRVGEVGSGANAVT